MFLDRCTLRLVIQNLFVFASDDQASVVFQGWPSTQLSTSTRQNCSGKCIFDKSDVMTALLPSLGFPERKVDLFSAEARVRKFLKFPDLVRCLAKVFFVSDNDSFKTSRMP